MKTVGLLSGGKDSVFNLLHCVYNGHQPVAVASLGPPEGKDELDSFMYQTVGHSGLKIMAEALGLPFFSQVIGGTAVNLGGEYGSRSGREKGKGKETEDEAPSKSEGEKDETEDLYELLRKVKSAYPDLEAVSVGAILSNYQRVRVEHVCQRLGLVPIAYLWERDQRELLGEMVNAGMESRLVKVAGAGLQVEHLGKSLAEMQSTLHRLNARYELHICGEGGEYETFTVDCPLFKRRIVLDETTTIISDPNPFATIAHLHLDTVSLGPTKPDVPQKETFEELQKRVRALMDEAGAVPPVLDERTEEWIEAGEAAAVAVEGEVSAEEEGKCQVVATTDEQEDVRSSVRTTDDGWVYFSEVVGSADSFDGEIENEVKACFSALTTLLAASSASLLSLTHLTVFLSPASSMSLFPRINAVYSSYFGTSPPTRACVAVAQSEANWRVKLEGCARKEGEGRERAEERKALHVQGLSYWAAANIGPYSQAVKTASRLYIAGQIPLIPASLVLPPPSSSTSTPFVYHASLSLQHLRRIADSASPGWLSPPTSSSSSSSPAPSAGRAESTILWLSPSSLSIFRLRVAAARAIWEASEKGYLEEQENEGALGGWRSEEGWKAAPFLAVEAGALPKGAEVEWQCTWGAPGAAEEDEEDDEEEEGGEGEIKETWARSTTVSNDSGKSLTYQCSQAFSSPSPRSETLSVTAVFGCSLSESRPHPLPGVDSSSLHTIRAFYRPSAASVSQVRTLARHLFSLNTLPQAQQPALSFIPTGKIATTLEGGDHDVAFVVVGAPAQ